MLNACRPLYYFVNCKVYTIRNKKLEEKKRYETSCAECRHAECVNKINKTKVDKIKNKNTKNLMIWYISFRRVIRRNAEKQTIFFLVFRMRTTNNTSETSEKKACRVTNAKERV